MSTLEIDIQTPLIEYRDPLAVTRARLVAEAIKYIGWPYRRHNDHDANEEPYTHGTQNDPIRGVDCSGLVRIIYETAGFPFKKEALHVKDILHDLGHKAILTIPQAGDIVIVKAKLPSQQQLHCGIADGHGRVIHASLEHSVVVIESLRQFTPNRLFLRKCPFLIGRVPDVLELLARKQ